MAYLDNAGATPKERLAALGTTGLVNAGLGAAVIMGLAASGTVLPEPPSLEGTNIPDVIIDPLPPKPEDIKEDVIKKTVETEIEVLKSPFKFPVEKPFEKEVSKPFEDSAGLTDGKDTENTEKPPALPKEPPKEPPAPPPAPLFKPKPPVPLNNAAGWVTPNDYPARELRRGSEGTARFTLTINENGSVTDCRIAQSSGHARLDKATCAKVKRRARFKPATDHRGANITDTYTSAVRWQIPE